MSKHPDWPKSRFLGIAGIPRSTYYFELSKERLGGKDVELREEIRAVFRENKGRYGVRRVTHALAAKGTEANHKKVQRLMSEMGLKGIRPKEKYHSYLGTVGKVAENLIHRDFKAAKPDEKWSTDVSQFNCPFGKCYLSPIIDMFTGEVISYDLATSPNFEQTNRMLDSAFSRHGSLKGLIFHSDQGWQYQMRQYSRRLKEKGIRQSMSRKGNCYDNCIIESFFGRLKNEMFYGHEKEFATFKEFGKAIGEYIDYYNNARIRSKTKWMPPSKYREASMKGL
jgi:transposase InsO family protein